MLQETERFCRWRHQKVAKIVQCGETDYDLLLIDYDLSRRVQVRARG
jgi:hypothetical protein